MAKVLVVEDDTSISQQIEDWLTSKKFVVECSSLASDAIERIRQYEYDVIILDWNLPDSTGIEILKKARSENVATPVLMLTARDTIDEKELGFETGADDYLTKPFDMRELTFRIRALLKRTTDGASEVLKYKHITLDPRIYELRVNGKVESLHAREFQLLEYLLRHPGHVFSADALLDRVWHADSTVGPETVRQCIKRIRKKVDSKDKESVIENIYGVGYRLRTD